MPRSIRSQEVESSASISAQENSATEMQPLAGIKLYSILIGVSIASFLIAMDASVIATAIPSITSRFHASTDIGWYGAAYPLTMCSLQPLSGKIATIFSLKWTYQISFVIFLFGSLLCGVATSSKMFIIGRAVAGIGGAGVVSGGLSVIAIVTPSEKRALFMGFLTSLYVLGTIIAPIIGGALTESVSWRWCFFINLPTGAVTIGSLLLFFNPPRKSDARKLSMREKILQLDLIGCGLFIASIIMVLLALEWGGNQYPWSSPTVIGLFVGFGGGILGFGIWEFRKGDQAMIPFSVFRQRSLLFSVLFGFLLLGSYVIPAYYLPEWFQVVKGANPMHSGIMMLPLVVSQILGSIVSGVLATRVGYYNPWFFLGSASLCVGAGLYTTFSAFSTTPAQWVSFEVVQGFGCGFAGQMPLLMAQAVLKHSPNQVPLGISLVLFAQYFGSSIMQSIGGAIFQNKLVEELTYSVGLNLTQVDKLLQGGNSRVRETTAENFPQLLHAVLAAYNGAITKVFLLSVIGASLAFVLSSGIEWINIRDVPERKQPENQLTRDTPPVDAKNT
ncbi:MFS general substrate transporter [Glonium stellatum]|uniref:MFS general substrate transporter n=1 Tax=Glonium stellatum TaxID=574774 RepID=A0A8E2FDT8_9PEZI|nr:MFS general substrate transporter [Glonium stellatum]